MAGQLIYGHVVRIVFKTVALYGASICASINPLLINA